MPEFILDLGEPEAARRFNALDEFVQGYIEAMFFTSTGHLEDEDLEHASFAELAADALAEITQDCERFQTSHAADLDEAIDNGRINGYDLKAAGRDFWYTRNHHGVGFWDRSLGAVGETLTKHCHAYRSTDLYRGDDGSLHIA